MSQSLLAIAAEVAAGAVVLPLATGALTRHLTVRRAAGGHGRGGLPPTPPAPDPCGDGMPAGDFTAWDAEFETKEATR